MRHLVKRISFLAIGSIYLFTFSNTSMAHKLDENALAEKLLKISQQAEELQREMKLLKAELNELKAEKKRAAKPPQLAKLQPKKPALETVEADDTPANTNDS